MRKVAVVIVAAGRSSRMRASFAGASLGEVCSEDEVFVPKPYMELGGKAIFLYGLEVLGGYGVVQPVIGLGDEVLYEEMIERWGLSPSLSLCSAVVGGETRAASVLAGLRALALEEPDIVIIHDAARPFIDGVMVERLLAALDEGYQGVAPVLPVGDALKVSEGDEVKGFNYNYNHLVRTQTPQVFCYQTLMEAFKHSTLDEKDELAVLEGASGQMEVRTKLIYGDHRNVKITYAEDLERCAGFMPIPSPSLSCVGIGVDVHCLTDGDHVMLGGVRVAHDRGIAAHSDGDVVLHALTDAIFGAIAGGDLGIHFPGEPCWKDCDSAVFLGKALDDARERGYAPERTDVTIICERPAISPHREVIRRRIGELLSVPLGGVSVKATTTDGAGLIGREGAIAAMAVIQLRRR